MKKLLAVLLAAIMILSFAGCGNSTAELEKLLVSEKWVCVYDSSHVQEFYSNKAGEIANAHSSGPINWEAIDSKTVETTFSGIFGDETKTRFVLSNENGMDVLADRHYIYVKESDYEKAREIYGNSIKIPRGTITNNNGETEYLTANELGKILEKNEVKFKNLYVGAEATIIGEVLEIKEDKIVLGEDTFSCWEVYNCSSSELVMFDIGDVVIATGTIRDAFVGQVELVEKTTIKHYNG